MEEMTPERLQEWLKKARNRRKNKNRKARFKMQKLSRKVNRK